MNNTLKKHAKLERRAKILKAREVNHAKNIAEREAKKKENV